MTLSIPFKRGDTFLLQGTVTVASLPQNLTGWTLRSQVRHAKGALVNNLTILVTDAVNGIYQLSLADTTEWVKGPLSCDIEYTDPTGKIFSTDTFIIDVLEDITQ